MHTVFLYFKQTDACIPTPSEDHWVAPRELFDCRADGRGVRQNQYLRFHQAQIELAGFLQPSPVD